MRRHLALMTITVLGSVLVAHVWAQPPWAQAQGKNGPGFQGYWIGVDPLDGGDSRRSFVQREDGRFALAGRDTVLTLCDETDRGFISFADGVVVSRNVMQSERVDHPVLQSGRVGGAASEVRIARQRFDGRGHHPAEWDAGEQDCAAQGEPGLTARLARVGDAVRPDAREAV